MNPPEPRDATEPQPETRSRLRAYAAAGIALAIAVAAALWIDARIRIGATQEEIARRLRDIEGESRDARAVARRAEETVREMHARIGALETRLIESQSQQLALEALYQELSRSRDEWQLAEIEQVLAIAQQQLQLAGNVRAALLALQLAEGRLSRSDRPQFLPVRRALARDIERLKSVPALDLSGMSLALDRLVAAVDALPLALDERAERASSGKGAKPEAREESFLVRLGGEIWKELRQLVVVRKVEAPDPPLLAPPQAYFVRENLKLRLLNARVALLTRNESGYREDLRVAQAWIRRYFDARSKAGQAILGQLKALSAASINIEPPSIAESLEAVRGFKSRRERSR